MTKIIIEESITSTIKTGVGKHTVFLNKIIPALGVKYEIISNKQVEKIKNATIKRLVHLIWLNSVFLLKLLKERKNDDVIVIYTSFLPIVKLKNIQQIGIMHDVLLKVFPQKMSKLAKLNGKLLNILIQKKTDKILVMSDTVLQEIKKYYPIEDKKMFVVYPPCSLEEQIEINEENVLKKFNLENDKKNYFICVSSLNPNKNIQCLVEAFEKFNIKHKEIKLIMVGGKPNVLKKYFNISDNKNVIFTGFISDEELKILYKNALSYVFPSLYEGFGVPLIDAQLFNIPVICSDIPVFHEVCQNSALYSDITPDDFAQNMEKILLDDKLRADLINKGRENIKRFQYPELYKQLIKLLGV